VLPLSDLKAVKVLAAGTMAFDAESGQVALAEEAGPAGLDTLFEPMPCLGRVVGEIKLFHSQGDPIFSPQRHFTDDMYLLEMRWVFQLIKVLGRGMRGMMTS
jgi:hypothetical protein